MKKILSFILISLISSHAHTKEPTQDRYFHKINGHTCVLLGAITRLSFVDFYNNMAKGCRTLEISSPGGDVATAIEMGKLVRRNQTIVIVSQGGKCASACVLIYAGGVARLPYGRVEIHRPYLTRPDESFAATQNRYREIEKTIKKYLAEVNVKENLYEAMMSVPPQQSRDLTLEELDALGMGTFDPVYQEYLDNKAASEYGLSKQEWMSLQRHADRMCGSDGIKTEHELPIFEACRKTHFIDKLPPKKKPEQ